MRKGGDTIRMFCKICNKNHIMEEKKCPECGEHYTWQPKSEEVYANCFATYVCEGCLSYREHLDTTEA